jgi:glycosyltransferase involved in cell wall biosynthesis
MINHEYAKVTVAVLLSHFNGYQYIREQVYSIKNQTGVNTHLIIRDDGSTCSKSLTLLKNIESEYATFCRVIYGRNIGACASFFELVRSVDGYSYYAFSDQDDVWDNNKLLLAIDELINVTDVPALYCSNVKVVDSNMKLISYKQNFVKPTFYSSLFNNICTGCTAVFNNNLRDIFINTKTPTRALMHDWWFYILATSTGVVIYDLNAAINYRQHESNIVGVEASWLITCFRRVRSFVNYSKNKYCRYKQAMEFQKLYGDKLCLDKREFLRILSESKDSFSNRCQLAFHRNLKLNGLLDTIVLRLLILSGRY